MKLLREQPLVLGLGTAVIGIAVWTIERRTGIEALAVLVILAKLVSFIAVVLGVRQISEQLYKRPLLATSLAFACFFVVGIAATAFLPYRTNLALAANDGGRRWYFPEMSQREGDYEHWLNLWLSFFPHRVEAVLVLCALVVLIVPGAFWRVRLRGSIFLCFVAALALAIVPVATGLLAFDYDTFLLGVALDSVALDLWPMGLAYGDYHSIFLLGLMAICFATSWGFLKLISSPRQDSVDCAGATLCQPQHSRTQASDRI